MEFKHKPVMLEECIEGLNIKPDGIYVDGTLGGAGHSKEILKRLSKNGLLIGIDRDEEALKAAKENLKEFENDEMVYNIKFTDDDKYSSMSNLTKEESDKIANILSIEDLQDNLKNQLSASNGSIYVVIGFASVMAFVIILIIANVVVEENKKTISLMKVMGYDDKSVSSIVLNIYTPFIIIAYLLAIPAMKKLLEFIVSKLTGSMDFAIPIEFSWIKTLIGLAGLLISYFIAIFISRRVLNKVPLSVALKRE